MNKAAEHKNSRIVHIFRSATFLGASQKEDVQQYLSLAKQDIGSYWAGVDSKKQGSGLLDPEIKLLLPEVVEVTADHPEFVKRVNIFYSEISTPVPYRYGVKLETGLFVDNNAPLSKDNMPIDTMDYIRWKHATKHPHVALSKDLAEGNNSKHFYIFDKAIAETKQQAVHEVQDKAMQLYMGIKDKPEKVTMMLTLLGEDITKLPSPHDKLTKFRTLAEKKAADLMKIHEEGDVDQRYWLKAMTDNRILKVLHNKYFITENDKMIGNSLEEAIFFFKDEENSEMIQFLKSALQEKLEKKELMK